LGEGKNIVSFWLPLDMANETNGVLEFVKGSHKWNTRRYVHPEQYDREIIGGADWKMQPGNLQLSRQHHIF
jgi:ectoine hydroxylase-related dioxygenase (phytanoyl-CoA dioxygenase family)